MNFQSSHPTPHTVTCSHRREPAPPAHSRAVGNIWIAVQVSHASSRRSLEISAHIFYFPGTQIDEAITDTLHYRVLTIWQKNETGKFSIAGNNDGAVFSLFLPPAKSCLHEAATQPLIPTGRKNKAGEKVKLIKKKHKPFFPQEIPKACLPRPNTLFASYSSVDR